MKMKPFVTGTALICLMPCAGCTDALPVPPPVIVMNGCPKVSLCPMPASDPKTNGDLSAAIRQLERALERCALQAETIRQCQEDSDAETRQSAQSTH